MNDHARLAQDLAAARVGHAEITDALAQSRHVVEALSASLEAAQSALVVIAAMKANSETRLRKIETRLYGNEERTS